MHEEDEKSYCYIDHANKRSEIYHSAPQLHRFNQKRKKNRNRDRQPPVRDEETGADLEEPASKAS